VAGWLPSHIPEMVEFFWPTPKSRREGNGPHIAIAPLRVPNSLIGKLSDWAEVAIGVPCHKVSVNSLVAPLPTNFLETRKARRTEHAQLPTLLRYSKSSSLVCARMVYH
jgi:hypothetical protein